MKSKFKKGQYVYASELKRYMKVIKVGGWAVKCECVSCPDCTVGGYIICADSELERVSKKSVVVRRRAND